ncbi:MAG: hypothetical protein AB7P03_15445 [Kofleriaceae bacterium]
MSTVDEHRGNDKPEPEPLATEPTPEGRYLHEPDGFPHATMALLVFVLFVTAGIVLFASMRVGVIAGIVVIVIGLPWLVWRVGRTAKTTRRKVVVEHNRERQEIAKSEEFSSHVDYLDPPVQVPDLPDDGSDRARESHHS